MIEHRLLAYASRIKKIGTSAGHIMSVNMISEVERMIRHVSRGQVPENVRMMENLN